MNDARSRLDPLDLFDIGLLGSSIDGDDWVLNSSKMWITNGNIADVAVVWAMTDEGVRGFLVERDMPGFAAQEIENKFSLRASVTSALFLDNVRVPAEYVPIRHMLNLESVITYEGTETVHQFVVGKELTSVNAFG